MTWVRLDDQFADNPKLERAGPMAGWLHVSALCYCARHLTDGLIPWEKAARLVSNPGKPLKALIQENVWHKEDHDCPTCPPCPHHHYLIHDYLDYQPSRAQVEKEREAARERMAKARRNKQRSSPEHPPNDEGTSDNPDPTRPPSDLHPPPTNVGTRPESAGEGSSLIEEAVQLAATRYGRNQVQLGKGSSEPGLAKWWLQENAVGARQRAASLLSTHVLTLTQLADALVSGNPQWLSAYRRKDSA